MATKFFPDKELDENILNHTQVPSNINGAPMVDSFIESMLNEKHKQEHIFDKSMFRIGKKGDRYLCSLIESMEDHSSM